jgi:PST family polysaccharide transporter
MLLLIVPVTLWAIKGTPVSPGDIWSAVRPPLYSVMVAAAVASLVSIPVSHLSFPLLRLFLVNGVLFGTYAAMLFFVMGQKALYLKVLHGLGFGKRVASSNPEPAREMYSEST